ncbi:MAG: TIR domain-containing protein [Actinobacteria bacterium]|nr:TIR domain-containing protein [Actinomycetota bacterium]
MADIFMSYVQEDSAVAEEIALGLERVGFTTWYYERDSEPVTPWLTQVAKAIEQAGAVVLLISRNSLDSKQVTSEIDWARSKGRPFAPVLLGVTHEEMEERQVHWAFALGAIVAIAVPEDGLTEQFFSKLARGLENVGVGRGKAARPAADDLDERLAAVRLMLNDPERRATAEEALRKILADYPESGRAYRFLGEFYNRSFRPRDALGAFEKAAELEPGSALTQWELGLAYRREGRTEDAVRTLQRSLDIGLDPGREGHAKTLVAMLQGSA